MSARIFLLEVGTCMALALLGLAVYGLAWAEPATLSVSRPFLWAGLVLGAINFIASVRGLRLARHERREERLALELDRAWRA